MIGPQRLEQIKVGYELTTLGKWAIYYPQSRSKPHIVSTDEYGALEWYIAQGIAKDDQCRDDIIFACNSHQDIPELIQEVERLQAIEQELEDLRGELRELFGLDYREGIKQFREAMKQV